MLTKIKFIQTETIKTDESFRITHLNLLRDAYGSKYEKIESLPLFNCNYQMLTASSCLLCHLLTKVSS